jgi:dimethylglycine catabolism B
VSASLSIESTARQLDNCTFCPKMCRLACPVSTASGRETLIPQAKMDKLNQLRKGHAAWSAAAAEPLWGCTGCGQCTNYCDHGNQPGLVLMSGRAEATARGAGHPALADYPDRFRNRDERLVGVLRTELPDERRAPDALVGFWPGCDGVDKHIDDVVRSLELFDRVGAEHVRVVDGGQACAGYPLLAAGYPDMFRWHAGKVAAALKPFRTVIVNCSACVWAMRSAYPAEGVPLSTEVLALSEFLAQAVNRLPRPAKPRTVYYHDPCYLARYANVLEAPRRVLAQVADVREFTWSGTDTECCGGAGMLPKTMPDIADSMARRRLRDIAGRGGGTVVTSCGTCAFMLKRNAPDGVEVRDLATAVTELAGT